ncbi:MAG: hypothetical protein WCO26_21495 [Deltaproteobacteria bacterium]
MDRTHRILEGIGRGRLGRIAVAKLGVDVDLLEGIRELLKREGGGHLIPGVITSIKVVVVIGVIEESNINAAVDPATNQVDLAF